MDIFNLLTRKFEYLNITKNNVWDKYQKKIICTLHMMHDCGSLERENNIKSKYEVNLSESHIIRTITFYH